MAADPNALPVQGPATIGNPFPVSQQPPGSTGSPQTAVQGSQQGGNQSNAATLTAVAAKTTYISGLVAVIGGATAALAATLTISGLLGGSIVIPVEAQAGVGASPQVISIAFSPPLPASAVSTNIVATLSALGAGNVTAGVAAWGFNQ